MVSLWLRVPAGATHPGEDLFDAAYVRVLHDGEPRFVAAVIDSDRSGATETWWRAEVTSSFIRRK